MEMTSGLYLISKYDNRDKVRIVFNILQIGYVSSADKATPLTKGFRFASVYSTSSALPRSLFKALDFVSLARLYVDKM